MPITILADILAHPTAQAGGASINITNLALDIILVVASVWMIVTVRGVGGVVGRTLNLIVVGAIILGAAHLIATLDGVILATDPDPTGVIHRILVLIGFIFLVFGFRQLSALKG